MIEATRSRYRGRVPRTTDRILGGSAFVVAGALFIGSCVLAGFLVLVAHGVDVPREPGPAAADIALAAWTWCPAALAAVAGLVLWIVAGVRGAAMLRWALPDLLVQAAAFGVLLGPAANRG